MPIPNPVKELTPTEFIKDSKKISYREDLEKAYAVFSNDPTKTLTFFPLRHDGNHFHLILDGNPNTEKSRYRSIKWNHTK